MIDSKNAEWNSCASLVNTPEFTAGKEKYYELLKNNEDPMKHMLKMQLDLQVELSKKSCINPNPNTLNTIGEKFDWLRENKQSFDDEYRELIDALPGMDTPAKERSAVWKKWKSKYKDIRSKTFDDLSAQEMYELKFELIDAFHFFMNMMFPLHISAEELFIFYYTKNHENHNRIKNGY